MESSRGLVDERDAPISCVLGEEWLSLPGWRLTLLGMRGGRGQDVTGQGEAGEVRGGGHPHPPLTTPPTPAAQHPPPVGSAGLVGRRGGCWRARRHKCRREAGAAGGARQARKAVLGAVPVWPAAGGGPG